MLAVEDAGKHEVSEPCELAVRLRLENGWLERHSSPLRWLDPHFQLRADGGFAANAPNERVPFRVRAEIHQYAPHTLRRSPDLDLCPYFLHPARSVTPIRLGQGEAAPAPPMMAGAWSASTSQAPFRQLRAPGRTGARGRAPRACCRGGRRSSRESGSAGAHARRAAREPRRLLRARERDPAGRQHPAYPLLWRRAGGPPPRHPPPFR